MSILTDLRAACAAVDAARKTLAEPLPLSEIAYLEREEALYSALGTYHKLLTDDTIRALLDVAEAATEVRLSDICALMEDWYCEAHSCDACGSVTYPCVLAPLRAMERTLSPLVEEATDE